MRPRCTGHSRPFTSTSAAMHAGLTLCLSRRDKRLLLHVTDVQKSFSSAVESFGSCSAFHNSALLCSPAHKLTGNDTNINILKSR
jgi:hypothetical protein